MVPVILFGKQEIVLTLVMLTYIHHLEIHWICLFFIRLKFNFTNGVALGFCHQQNGAHTTPVCAKLVLLIRQTFIMDQEIAYAMQATREQTAAHAQLVAPASTRHTEAMTRAQTARRTRTTC